MKRSPNQPIRVLVVEDSRAQRELLLALLRSSTDFEVVGTASNGKEAVAEALRLRPNVIAMDIYLPLLDGYEATRRIKADPALRSIPIIAVTSYALSGDDLIALEAGCSGYVTKPFSPRQLLAKIKEHLSLADT